MMVEAIVVAMVATFRVMVVAVMIYGNVTVDSLYIFRGRYLK